MDYRGCDLAKRLPKCRSLQCTFESNRNPECGDEPSSPPACHNEEEVEAALEKERTGKTVLFPIRPDDAVMETGQAWAASLRRTRHIGDLRNWKDHDAFKKAFERLLRDLKNSDR